MHLVVPGAQGDELPAWVPRAVCLSGLKPGTTENVYILLLATVVRESMSRQQRSLNFLSTKLQKRHFLTKNESGLLEVLLKNRSKLIDLWVLIAIVASKKAVDHATPS